ncbi:SpaA isopeptide-forming pilin-related protein [Streptomyces sp. NPDC058872]|uniref:SpaA isopeptide-forming pilin-related protein n=1 Tax=Streptomyces sp. NPDC058872 TaxID=3346661 RepID=UPI003692AE05
MKHHHVLPTLALAATAVLAATPAAFAASSSDPMPSPSTARAETPVSDAGGIEITTKDPAGDVLSGATFLLLDSAGKEAGNGKTDAQGKLTFPDLAPGVYRLKETASGSPLHEAVADQDVIVTPGATTRLTITDPFKAAKVLLQAKDDKTGKLLAGATVNIGTGDTTLLTLTTGTGGTASAGLPVSSRKAEFWAMQIKAPAGYDLYKPSKTFTAGPGAPVTVTVTNAATNPKPTPLDKPTPKPTSTPSAPTDEPSSSPTSAPKPTQTDTGTPGTGSSPTADGSALDASSSTASPSAPATSTGDSAPAAPIGSLAHTGADTTSWIAGGAGLLVVAGAVTLVVTRRRGAAEREPDDISETI